MAAASAPKAKIFDYSKWDKIELSDDESDLHPNIDKDSWFRLKHRTRLEREEREDKEVKEYEKLNAADTARLKIIRARLDAVKAATAGTGTGAAVDADAEFEDVEALESEMAELQHRVDERLGRTQEILERRKWNIDNICQVKEERTIVGQKEAPSLKAEDFKPTGVTSAAMEANSAAAAARNASASTESSTSAAAAATSSKVSPPAPPTASPSSSSPSSSASSLPSAPKASSTAKAAVGPRPDSPTRERFAVVSYNDFAHLHERLLETYSDIEDLERSKDYLFKHCDVLLHEHAQSYMLLSSLEDEMNGKHKRMRLVCRQSQILSHIQELGTSMRRDPRDVVLPFFRRLEEAEHLKAFLGAVEEFIKRIQKRAVEKRKEMAAEERANNAKAAGINPDSNGLDPYDVFESLPAEMQAAFESQDIAALQRVLAEMDPQEARRHMKRCVDSGLWVPKGDSPFEDDDDEEENGSGAAGGP